MIKFLKNILDKDKTIISKNKLPSHLKRYIISLKNNKNSSCSIIINIWVFIDPSNIPWNIGSITKNIIIKLTDAGYNINCSTGNNSIDVNLSSDRQLSPQDLINIKHI